MKYTLTYARVGNARPLYCLRDEYNDHYLCFTVQDVAEELSIPTRRVRELCKRARSGEVVEFRGIDGT